MYLTTIGTLHCQIFITTLTAQKETRPSGDARVSYGAILRPRSNLFCHEMRDSPKLALAMPNEAATISGDSSANA